jgi:hypothetical protein
MKRRLLASLLFGAATPLAAAPFAMVTELKGDARSVDGNESRKLALLSYIEKPTQIQVDPAGRLVVTYFANGVQYSFEGPSKASLEVPNPKVIQGAQPQARKITPDKAIGGGGLSPDQWRRLQQATMVMRSVRPGFSVIGPDKTVLLDTQPEFEWTSAPHAKGYRLVVYADNAVIHEARTEANSLRPGEALKLQPGRRYRWKVDAIGVQKPVSTSGAFTVAETPVRKDMLGLKASMGSDAAARAFYATALEAQGHTYDARAEWKALARDFPEEAEYSARAR